MDKPTSHRSLILAIGGPSELARDLGIYKPVPATVHWSRRGIPARYWPLVCEVAAKKKIPITPSELARLPANLEAA